MQAIITREASRHQDACRSSRCTHLPRCPAVEATDALAAAVIVSHPEQDWSLLCDGMVAFDDGGAITSAGTTIASLHGAPLSNPSCITTTG
jgi:hypothetical protein